MSYGDYRQSCLERKYDERHEKPSNGKKKKKNKAYKWTVRREEPVLVFGRLSFNERHFVKKEDADKECEKRMRLGLRPDLNPLYIVVPYDGDI